MSRGKELCEGGVDTKREGPGMEGPQVCREWVICIAIGTLRTWKHADLGRQEGAAIPQPLFLAQGSGDLQRAVRTFASRAAPGQHLQWAG